jgi:hypothetical protein
MLKFIKNDNDDRKISPYKEIFFFKIKEAQRKFLEKSK